MRAHDPASTGRAAARHRSRPVPGARLPARRGRGGPRVRAGYGSARRASAPARAGSPLGGARPSARIDRPTEPPEAPPIASSCARAPPRRSSSSWAAPSSRVRPGPRHRTDGASDLHHPAATVEPHGRRDAGRVLVHAHPAGCPEGRPGSRAHAGRVLHPAQRSGGRADEDGKPSSRRRGPPPRLRPGFTVRHCGRHSPRRRPAPQASPARSHRFHCR